MPCYPHRSHAIKRHIFDQVFGAVAEVDGFVVGPGSAIERVVARIALKAVVAAAARDRIRTAVPDQGIVGRVADDGIAAAAAHGAFDHGAPRDRHVSDPAADVREGFGVEVDPLVR